MDKEFEQYLINNKIPYKQIGNNKIAVSTIDSVNGNRHRFVVDLNTGDSTNDPFAHPGPVSWKVVKDTDGYILKGVNSMYRDQLFMPPKKEDPQLYEVIERITAPKKVVTSNKPKSTSTVTKSTSTASTTSKGTEKFKRTVYDSEGNVVSIDENFLPIDLDTLSQRLGQRTPVSLQKGNKIEGAMEDWIIEFIKRNEDFIPVAKKLKGESHPTVGYGTYLYYANGEPVKEGDKITEEAAEQLILLYINKVMPEVYRYLPEFDNYPSLMKGAIIDTIYRGGGTSLKNSPAFVGAVNKGFEDKKFNAEELAAIVKEMGLKVIDPEKDRPSNLNDRKERRAAMMYGIYNTEHDNSIRSLGGKGAKTTPYTNFHIDVRTPGTMWNTVYKTSTSPADFAVRLWNTDRETIPDWETDTPTSNKLGYVTEGDHEVIFPLVQYVKNPFWKFWAPDRELVDYTDPKYKMSLEDIYKKAVQIGDTLHVPKGAALPFIKKYETYIPGLKKGSKIHIKEKNKGKFTESAKRAGKSVQEHANDVVNDPKATKLQKKRAQFALNSKKFKHLNGGKLNYLNLF